MQYFEYRKVQMIKFQTYPKQLVLVRHAESLLNVIQAKSPSFFVTAEERKPFIGFPDHKVGLTERGVVQAQKTGKGLFEGSFKFDAVYDSGYERTVRTLDHILEAYTPTEREKMQRFHDLSLREREGGYSYCMLKAEMDASFAWLQEYWQTLGPVLARPVGGESIADVITRVQVCLHHIFLANEGKNVLIVLHGRVLSAVRYVLEGWSLQELEDRLGGHKNCGVTRYEYDPLKKHLELAEYNTCHW